MRKRTNDWRQSIVLQTFPLFVILIRGYSNVISVLTQSTRERTISLIWPDLLTLLSSSFDVFNEWLEINEMNPSKVCRCSVVSIYSTFCLSPKLVEGERASEREREIKTVMIVSSGPCPHWNGSTNLVERRWRRSNWNRHCPMFGIRSFVFSFKSSVIYTIWVLFVWSTSWSTNRSVDTCSSSAWYWSHWRSFVRLCRASLIVLMVSATRLKKVRSSIRRKWFTFLTWLCSTFTCRFWWCCRVCSWRVCWSNTKSRIEVSRPFVQWRMIQDAELRCFSFNIGNVNRLDVRRSVQVDENRKSFFV